MTILILIHLRYRLRQTISINYLIGCVRIKGWVCTCNSLTYTHIHIYTYIHMNTYVCIHQSFKSELTAPTHILKTLGVGGICPPTPKVAPMTIKTMGVGGCGRGRPIWNSDIHTYTYTYMVFRNYCIASNNILFLYRLMQKLKNVISFYLYGCMYSVCETHKTKSLL